MASLQTHHYHLQLQRRCVSSLTAPKLRNLRFPNLSLRFPTSLPGKVRVFTLKGNGRGKDGIYLFCCVWRAGAEIEKVDGEEGSERPPFYINLAVVLAGFAFEAYSSPPLFYKRSGHLAVMPGRISVLKDLLTFMRTTNPNDIMLNFLVAETERTKKASAVILNTFHDLEDEVVDALSTLLPPIYSIGRLNLQLKQIPTDNMYMSTSNFIIICPFVIISMQW